MLSITRRRGWTTGIRTSILADRLQFFRELLFCGDVEIIISSSRRQANIFPVQLGDFELVNVSVDCYESSMLHIGYCTSFWILFSIQSFLLPDFICSIVQESEPPRILLPVRDSRQMCAKTCAFV